MALIRKIVPPNLPVAPLEYERRWQDQFSNVLRLFFSQVVNSANTDSPENDLKILDGVDEPEFDASAASIYIDKVSGDLKIKFSDGTVKTIVTDT